MPVLDNAKHEAVAQAYIADRERIGWRAYRSVYPKSAQHTAESAWSALMKNPEFSARIAELAEQAASHAVMTAQEVLQELSKIGRANAADFVRAFACLDPVEAMDKLTPEQTAALAEVTVEDFMEGRGEDARAVRRIKFKLTAKTPALDLLGKHHKLYVDRVQHDLAAGVAERLAAAIARVGDKDPDDRDDAGGARQAPDQERPPGDPPDARPARPAARKGGGARPRRGVARKDADRDRPRRRRDAKSGVKPRR